MTNRRIAHTLSLAEKTGKNDVSSMLGKLEMGSRTQAALFAAKREHTDGGS
jgi:two-component system response regulator DevR